MLIHNMGATRCVGAGGSCTPDRWSRWGRQVISSRAAAPYSDLLLGSTPRLDGRRSAERVIEGKPPDLMMAPAGCSFRDGVRWRNPGAQSLHPSSRWSRGATSGAGSRRGIHRAEICRGVHLLGRRRSRRPRRTMVCHHDAGVPRRRGRGSPRQRRARRSRRQEAFQGAARGGRTSRHGVRGGWRDVRAE